MFILATGRETPGHPVGRKPPTRAVTVYVYVPFPFPGILGVWWGEKILVFFFGGFSLPLKKNKERHGRVWEARHPLWWLTTSSCEKLGKGPLYKCPWLRGRSEGAGSIAPSRHKVCSEQQSAWSCSSGRRWLPHAQLYQLYPVGLLQNRFRASGPKYGKNRKNIGFGLPGPSSGK